MVQFGPRPQPNFLHFHADCRNIWLNSRCLMSPLGNSAPDMFAVNLFLHFYLPGLKLGVDF